MKKSNLAHRLKSVRDHVIIHVTISAQKPVFWTANNDEHPCW